MTENLENPPPSRDPLTEMCAALLERIRVPEHEITKTANQSASIITASQPDRGRSAKHSEARSARPEDSKVQHLIGGPLEPTELLQKLQHPGLTILSTRPGKGKTTACIKVATQMALAPDSDTTQNRILFCTIEHSPAQLIRKILATCADAASFSSQREFNETQITKYTIAAAKIQNAPIRIIDGKNICVDSFAAYARREHQREPFGLIVIDYFQLMNGWQKRQESSHSLESKLHHIAIELNVPILIASQLSRHKIPIPA